MEGRVQRKHLTQCQESLGGKQIQYMPAFVGHFTDVLFQASRKQQVFHSFDSFSIRIIHMDIKVSSYYQVARSKRG